MKITSTSVVIVDPKKNPGCVPPWLRVDKDVPRIMGAESPTPSLEGCIKEAVVGTSFVGLALV